MRSAMAFQSFFLVGERRGDRGRGLSAGPGSGVEAALRLLATAPAPGARILARLHRRGARPAAEAGEAAVVKGVVGDAQLEDAVPDVLLGPADQRVHLHQAEASVPLDDLGAGALLR